MGERRAALVTGAGQGIGRCIATRLAEAGYGVMVLDLDASAAFEAAGAVAAAGGEVEAVAADVGDEAAVAAGVAAAVARFGGLDLLVNNAGIMIGRPLEQLTRQEWDRVIATNLTGAFLCSRGAAPALRARRGCIVNIASSRAVQSEPGTEAYAASKGGLVALTHALAASLAPDVRVNCISPGWIDCRDWRREGSPAPPALTAADHAQHFAGRVGNPDDVAGLVLHLASAAGGFISGSNIIVDGGMTRKMIYV